MVQTTLLTDDLLRQLMAVGQVDIVVGVPTLNNAGTIGATLQAVNDGLSRYFPRARAVIIGADAGSRDGTVDIVEAVTAAARRSGGPSGGLRTRHQVSTSYRDVTGRAGAIRLIFTAGDLLQARAMAVLDPDVETLTPGWIGMLVEPVWKQSFDFVTPLYGRHPLEGLLITQLFRPLLRATYGRQVDEPLIGEFACSGRFAGHCLTQDVWGSSPINEGIELWLTGTALTRDFRACQAFLGPRTLAPSPHPRPDLRDRFPLLVGSLFASLEKHATFWLPREGSEPLPTMGAEPIPTTDPPSVDPARLGGALADDVRNLGPVLGSILTPGTLATLSAMAGTEASGPVDYPDDVWVATVYDFLGAHHAGVMDRAHIAQALMSLYLGRAASFVTKHTASPPAEVVQDLERLSLQFERAKPSLIERWTRAA